ncbi:hypothetical protein BV25DRAFT_1850670 [Artomyces pyxidatus]|uniref:Uncharacterized protein n=1 Tax=Artomyces pyxidatus TaxID=48021 RepID=A0ACB8TBI1_9AGAM|nr:hypothetical protein BV25DRAFT_1850670 [Artomyces pyxidatus]
MKTHKIELVSNGVPTSFSFTDSSFLVQSSDRAKPKLEVPLKRILWAGITGNVIDVHVLAKKHARLVLVKVEGRASDVGEETTQWVEELMRAAYPGVKPQRRFLVIINPAGGPGKANIIFKRKVEPMLRIAHCTYETIFTEYQRHAVQIGTDIALDKYDAILVVSGDGVLHELFNGFAQHAEPRRAFKIPIAPIPAGSGNGTSLNLIGLEEGQDVSAAALNAIKGRPMPVDLCSVLQNEQRSFSFMTQCVGLMADLDLGTEHLRWMGSNRFVYGFLRGIITRKSYPFSIAIKALESDKAKMLDSLRALRSKSPEELFQDTATDEVVDNTLPPLRYVSDDPEGWITMDEPILYMYAGKGPFVSRDLMQFPVSMPNDGVVDVVVQAATSRVGMLKGMDGAEHGAGYWRNSARYYKAVAYRVKPLKSQGYLSIDGEKFPYEEFRVEVHQGLGTLLSPLGRYAAEFDDAPPDA